MKAKLLIASALSALVLGMLTTAASAVDYTATQASTDVTGFLGTVVTSAAPMFLAVAAGLVGLFLLQWGIKTVLRKVRSVRVG